MTYEEALNKIKDSYDAFYILNKYGKDGENTHHSEFELLANIPKLSLEKGALCWVKYEYDCYYKDEYENEKGTAFEYIRKLCKKYDSEKQKK